MLVPFCIFRYIIHCDDGQDMDVDDDDGLAIEKLN